VAVIDQTGQVADDIRRYLSPTLLAERRAAPGPGADAMQKAALGEVPDLDVLERPASALEEEKNLLRRGCKAADASRCW